MVHRRIGSTFFALALCVALVGPSLPVLAAQSGAEVTMARHKPPHHDDCDGKSVRGDEKCAPEAPLPIGLPLTGLAVFGGFVWFVRRRQAGVGSLEPRRAES